MKNNIHYIILIIFFSSINLYSQTFIGNYTFIDNQNSNPILASSKKYTLFINRTNSIFTLEEDKLIEKIETQTSNFGDNVVMEKIDDNYARVISSKKNSYYRDYTTNNIFYNTIILNKEVFVNDKINAFDWKLNLVPVVYNNLHCSIANVNHRGRDWTVYYTLEIPFQGGPWKFFGLPGMIVYAKSDDGNYIFELTDYKVEKENINITNPFLKNKLLTWDEYTSNYYTSFKNLIKKMNSKDEDGSKTKITFKDLIEDLGFTEIN